MKATELPAPKREFRISSLTLLVFKMSITGFPVRAGSVYRAGCWYECTIGILDLRSLAIRSQFRSIVRTCYPKANEKNGVKSTMRVARIMLVTFVISACNMIDTRSKTPGDFPAVEADKILAPDYQKPEGERTIPVLFMRDSQRARETVDVILAIDGQPIVTLVPGCSFHFYMAPGSHKFQFIPQLKIPDEAVGEIRVDIIAGEVNNFLVYEEVGSGPVIERLGKISQ